MHEFNICQTIVDTVVEKMESYNPPRPRLVMARIVIGKLRQLVPEYLKFAYETLTKDTVAQGSVLDIEFKPIIGRCQKCGWSGEMTTFAFKCGECGDVCAEITGGRELYLESLEIEENE